MDTISMSITVKHEKEAKLIEHFIDSLYYCTLFKSFERKGDYIISFKLSYPRFFHKTNAFLITTEDQCFTVQEGFINSLKEVKKLYNITSTIIKVNRVDVPFTYHMEKGTEFDDYRNVYYLMALIWKDANKISNIKAINDFLKKETETIIFTDTKNTNAYNKKIIIYNQYARIRDTYKPNDFKYAIKKFPDLKQRMRIEISFKTKEVYNLINFEEANIFKTYRNKSQKMIETRLLDTDTLKVIIEDLADDLYSKTKGLETLKTGTFLADNQNEIYDYEVLRTMLMKRFNGKTFEQKLTSINKALKTTSISVITKKISARRIFRLISKEILK